MEEESGVKAAPVTRLRRRLSVETAEDTKSPGPSTPTKKRGGRLAAKPQLELIDEHAIQNSPKKSTRKSLARGVSESDEKPVTPARRSARVKSNTSLVLEPEEKIQTPSRRTTRISSNTSIISETLNVVESPRAKRATARRNSKAETLNVSAVTPRRTTRTRKGSTSSMDSMVQSNQPETLIVVKMVPDKPENLQSSTNDESPNNKIIPQESENQLRQSTTNDEIINTKNDTKDDTIRKSPRLMAKNGDGRASDDIAMCHLSECQHEDLTKIESDDKQFVQKFDAVMKDTSCENELVLASSKLSKKLVKKKDTHKNKSLSDIDISDVKSKRHRTQSWTTVGTFAPDEGKFYSDNESSRRKFKDCVKIFEEKIQTPSRRTTRISSNTSIISETLNVVESPRAKRATARRNSKAETLNVSAVTPRRTTRTRKGSTSSMDSMVQSNQPETLIVVEMVPDKPENLQSSTNDESPNNKIIPQESENQLRQSTTNDEIINTKNDTKDDTIRKSPRLMAKNGDGRASDDIAMCHLSECQHEDLTKIESDDKQFVQKFDAVMKDTSCENELVLASSKLSKKLVKKKDTHKNKSLSDIDISDVKSKRHRTQSWTTVGTFAPDEGKFYSDNESSRRKFKDCVKIFKDKRQSGDTSNDGFNEKSTEQSGIDLFLNTSKKNKKYRSFVVESNLETKNMNHTVKETSKDLNKSDDKNKENVLGVAPVDALEVMSQNTPIGEIKPMVFLEDSDSNAGSISKQEKGEQIDVIDSGDQCVPIVLHSNAVKTSMPEESSIICTVNSLTEPTQANTSCEPMEIDETMPENISLTDFKEDINSPKGTHSRKSSLTREEKSFKSKRKSSISSLEKHETTKKSNIDLNSQSANSQTCKLQNTSLCMPQQENFTKNKKSQGNESQKPYLSMQESDVSPNTSKRKSSITLDVEKSQNENKSTLILSQIKDISVSAENSVSKSFQISNDHSKSDVQDSMKEIPINKNLTLNYLTSTPVQQKSAEKLNIQMNTSIITPTNESRKKNNKDISQQNVFMALNSEKHKSDDDGSETEDSENESSTKNSELFTAEAEDAGEDYESGDSRDSDERQYELDNEIVDKGKTLTSEEEMSNDSDYEKDSFVVSSVEEDYDLLSGSGDDLNMSDNELSMNPKSKSKFNERKQKERKKASREIYEARHGNKKTGKTADDEANIKTRRRLDSTLLKSDDDNNMVPPKKNKRMRLESTLDSSQDKLQMKNPDETNISEEIFIHKKKKTKRFSESVCQDTTIDEKEMSVNKIIAGEDPLLVKVKPELKTPQKEFDLSTIHFTDRQEIVQVAVDENASIIKPNETLDPLQTSSIENNKAIDEDSDSISENEEIAKNYESMLEELNKGNKQHLKTLDLSLNLNKKSKKTKHSIIEKLNLTDSEIAKNDHSSSQFNKKTVKRVFKKLANTDEESSDSIDLKQIFPDSSNDSVESKDCVSKPEKSSIPLKRTEGKTDLFDSNGVVTDGADYIDGSIKKSVGKKNKKRKSGINISVNNMAQEDEDNETLPFFIDTKGDISDTERGPGMVSLEGNSEKNNNSVINFDLNEFAAADDNDNARLKVLFVSDKKIKRNKKVSENESSYVCDTNNDPTKTPGDKKKKKSDWSQSISLTAAAEENDDAPLGVSFVSDKKIKQNKKVAENETSHVFNTDDNLANTSSNNKRSKKKSDMSQNISLSAAADESDDAPLEVSFLSDKKIKQNKKVSENESSNVCDTNNDPAKTLSSGKKKKKSDQSQYISLTVENNNSDAPLEISFVSDKKKKRNKKEYENESGNVCDTNNDPAKTPSSYKKKKKSEWSQNIYLTEQDPALKNGENFETPHPEATGNVGTEKILPESGKRTKEHNISSSKKKQKDFEIDNTNMPAIESVNSLIKEENTKKSKKNKTVKDSLYSIYDKVNETSEVITTDNAVIERSTHKKRKRNSSESKSMEKVVSKGINESQENNEIFKGNKKKKIKTSSNVADMQQFQIQSVDSNGNRPKNLKQYIGTINSAEAHIKTSNKRKKRDDDESYNSSKKFKDNLLDKINVPRLSADIIQQLDEKPKKEVIVLKKAKVTSTTDFSVEETVTKRRKPSSFLEETVYLNQDDNTDIGKKKSTMKRPKVLPFLPTVSISDSGFTTKFQVNVISQKVEFSAKKSETTNFKEKYLNTKRLKKLRTYDLYKKQRCMKLSKF